MPSTISLDNPPALQRSHRGLLRRILTTATIPVAAALFITYAMTAEPRPAFRAPPETAAAPAPAAPEPLPRLVAPASVAAGSTLVILGYRDFDLCGPTEIRLDGAPLKVITIGGAVSANRSFVSIQIPTNTSTGPHRIELYGPMGTTGGMLCGRTAEHQARIATATITVYGS